MRKKEENLFNRGSKYVWTLAKRDRLLGANEASSLCQTLTILLWRSRSREDVKLLMKVKKRSTV